jgi:hypothetical protein
MLVCKRRERESHLRGFVFQKNGNLSQTTAKTNNLAFLVLYYSVDAIQVYKIAGTYGIYWDEKCMGKLGGWRPIRRPTQL